MVPEGRFRLEPLGVGGTGTREPRGLRPAAAVDGVVRRRLVRRACDDAVGALGVARDAPFPDELLQDCADDRPADWLPIGTAVKSGGTQGGEAGRRYLMPV